MTPGHLPSRRARLVVSDPWEFTTAEGSNTFLADVWESADTSALLLRLSPPAHVAGRDWLWFLALPGSAGDVAVCGLADEQVTADWASLSLSSLAWRGRTPAARAVLKTE